MYYDHYYKMKSEPTFSLQPDAIGCLPQSSYAAANPQKTFDLEEAFNSPAMRETRLSMLAGKKVTACQYCYERESGDAKSYRQIANEMFSEQTDLSALIEKTDTDGFLNEFPCYLDLRFGNTCNLQCVMCGFPISSRWGSKSELKWLKANIDPYESDTELWEMLRVNANKLSRIYFAGGEPFLQPLHFKLLGLLIQEDCAGRIDLAYNTNLTVLPDGIFDKLRKFRSVDIGASCDGTEELFESIRVGARWEAFVKNVRKTKIYFPVRLAVTPQKQNIAHLQSIIEWGISEGCEIDLTNILMYPEDLRITTLVAAERRLLANAYSQLSIRYSEGGYPTIAAGLANIVRVLSNPTLR